MTNADYLRVANAVAETRLKCAAVLMAAGVNDDRITYVGQADVCGLDVDGERACSLVPTFEDRSVTIDVLWMPKWRHLQS